MLDSVIKVEGLSKKYKLGQRGASYSTLRDSLSNLFHFSQSKTKNTKLSQEDSVLWALKEINLEIKSGEVVGVIGRNGAGKSTLLKIFSRITEPTTGRIELNGRVGSLLEVGTGFHPELTGRENIFLNGSIIGMRKREINRKFDEIVAFSEIEKFIDTPVKFYSSGMYVRLAFAVAAHLEPEILLVDEVLAVGDVAFQKKCLGKMGDVASQGRTVLFVSHNMAAIESLCSKAIVLEEGMVAYEGDVDSAIAEYLQCRSALKEVPLAERTDRKGDGRVLFTSISITNEIGNTRIVNNDKLHIKLKYKAQKEINKVSILIGIYDSYQRRVFFLDSRHVAAFSDKLPSEGTILCKTGPINLTSGLQVVNVAFLINDSIVDHVVNASSFEVVNTDFFGTGKLPDRNLALCLLEQKWSVLDEI